MVAVEEVNDMFMADNEEFMKETPVEKKKAQPTNKELLSQLGTSLRKRIQESTERTENHKTKGIKEILKYFEAPDPSALLITI